MAKLSALISTCARVTGSSLASVKETARRLREAELIQTGTGGRYGGAQMTSSDAASLLVALMVSRASPIPLTDIVSETKAYLFELRSYAPHSDHLTAGRWSSRLRLPLLCGLKKGHSFHDGLSALIESISNRDFEQAAKHWAANRPRGIGPFFLLSASLNSPRPHPEAEIKFNIPGFNTALIYLRPANAKKLIVPPAPRRLSDLLHEEYDLSVTASVEESTLTAIGTLLREA